jgi:cytidine deaminase
MRTDASPVKRSRETLTDEEWGKLATAAWKCRQHAFVIGNTKVGAAALCSSGAMFSGCNVEHRYRCHDVHAEVNAITSMVTDGHTDLVAILIAAERENFTPCGGCMDWIFQFGGPECLVAFQSHEGGERNVFTARDLMPHYPR